MKIAVHNITLTFENDKRIYLGDGAVLMPTVVRKVVCYGRNYANCPKCDRELGGYYNDVIRKWKHCPYCGEHICFID